ncbi:imidazole glycerol phosphate synthase subunit HisH [Treponema parvum]|uniref:Imidazole glycerol phosphate synthase subunit HisH n=1 Tax=Treponema parvum TaxID=138851 RepID=A0A975EY90_9SPIR|nr:imidazole glycerol phosphate synthase subunit HisH [Treponema parvum]QTQ11136.1 imidazole glycerol phosphate synthase subunit HisH [Treponema parvum]
MTGIVDYNAGNISSVERALSALNAPFILSKSPSALENCERLIFPGVGNASYAMEQLRITGFDRFLKDWAKSGKLLMGICLGAQIIFEYSEEDNTECLGLVKGSVRHFASVRKELNANTGENLKVPHMGWNDIDTVNGSSKLLEGIPPKSDFYFVHSYVMQPEDKSVIKAVSDYGFPVPACIECGNISAFQFHPEKSGAQGLAILKNYVKKDCPSCCSGDRFLGGKCDLEGGKIC